MMKQEEAVHSPEKPTNSELCQHDLADRRRSSRLEKSSASLVKVQQETKAVEVHCIRPYRCDICMAALKTRHSLRKHKLIHNTKRPFRCKLCRAAFKFKVHLKGHMVVHTNERPFKCEICGKSFPRKASYTRHRLRVHTPPRRGRRQRSPEDVVFVVEELFAEADGNSTPKKSNGSLNGEGCDNVLAGDEGPKDGDSGLIVDGSEQTTAKDEVFNSEVLRELKEEAEETKETSVFGVREFRHGVDDVGSANELNTAQNSDINGAKITFPRSNLSSRNADVVTAEDLMELPCSSAGPGIDSRKNDYSTKYGRCDSSSRQSFSSMSSGGKGKPANQKSEGQHERRFRCDVCFATFKTCYPLRRHKRSHEPKRAYRCTICSAAFKFKTHLEGHMVTHNEEKPFACDECGMRFPRKASWKRHCLKVHGNNNPATPVHLDGRKVTDKLSLNGKSSEVKKKNSLGDAEDSESEGEAGTSENEGSQVSMQLPKSEIDAAAAAEIPSITASEELELDPPPHLSPAEAGEWSNFVHQMINGMKKLSPRLFAVKFANRFFLEIPSESRQNVVDRLLDFVSR